MPAHKSKRVWRKCETCGTMFAVTEYRAKQNRGRYCSRPCIVETHRLTHGKTKTKEHNTWISMRSRCTNPKVKAYALYGAKGVNVCERWDSFERFLEDMGPAPSKKHQIDRIDSTKNYSPSNCRWVLPKDQARNTGRCKLNEEKAKIIRFRYSNGASVNDLADFYDVTKDTIYNVISGRTWA